MLRIDERLTALACITLLALHSHAAAADTMSCEALAAALQSQLSAIHSIDVSFDHDYVFSDAMHDFQKKLEKEGAVRDGAFETVREQWAEQGACVLHKELRRSTGKRPSTMMAFDGEKGYFHRWDSPVRNPDGLDIAREIPASYWERLGPAHAIGKRVSLCRQSLVDLIRLPTAVVRGTEDMLGSECYRIDVDGFETNRKQPLKLTAHLDPQHNLLPVRISVSYNRSDLPADISINWEIPEFMRVRDSAGGECWFPRIAREINVTGVHTFTMTSVKINDNLPVELFRPQPAEGTMIADAFDAEGRHTYILGGARAEEAAVARAVEQAKEELSANVAAGIVLDARPVARNASPWIFAFVSLVLCVTAAFFWMRR